MSSPDIIMENFTALAGGSVYFLLELEIGVVRDPRGDIFQVLIATPDGLRQNATREVITDRSTIIFAEFSLSILRKEIDTILKRCSGKSWEESVIKLQRYFRWEYEDYTSE